MVCLIIPSEAVMNNSVLERKERMKGVGVEGTTGRERSRHVSAGTLVSEDPEIEF